MGQRLESHSSSMEGCLCYINGTCRHVDAQVETFSSILPCLEGLTSKKEQDHCAHCYTLELHILKQKTLYVILSN